MKPGSSPAVLAYGLPEKKRALYLDLWWARHEDLAAPLDPALTGCDRAAYGLVNSLAELVLHADALTNLRGRRCKPGERPAASYRREAIEQPRETALYLGMVQRIFRGLFALGPQVMAGSLIEQAAIDHGRRANLLLYSMGGMRA